MGQFQCVKTMLFVYFRTSFLFYEKKDQGSISGVKRRRNIFKAWRNGNWGKHFECSFISSYHPSSLSWWSLEFPRFFWIGAKFGNGDRSISSASPAEKRMASIAKFDRTYSKQNLPASGRNCWLEGREHRRLINQAGSNSGPRPFSRFENGNDEKKTMEN